jgi:hypothetical protein
MSEIDTAERRISQLLGENPALRLLLGLLAAAIAAYFLIVRFRLWIPPELLSVALAIGPWLVILAVIGLLAWLGMKVYVRIWQWRRIQDTLNSRVTFAVLPSEGFNPPIEAIADFAQRVPGIRPKSFMGWVDRKATALRIVLTVTDEGQPVMLWQTPARFRNVLETAMTCYPGVDLAPIEQVKGLRPIMPHEGEPRRLVAKLGRPNAFPLKEVTGDPLAAFAELLNGLRSPDYLALVFDLLPVAPHEHVAERQRMLQAVGGPSVAVSSDPDGSSPHGMIERRVGRQSFWEKASSRGAWFHIQVLAYAEAAEGPVASSLIQRAINGLDQWSGLNFFGRDEMDFKGIFGGPDAFWRRFWYTYRLRTGYFGGRGIVTWREVAGLLKPWTRECSNSVLRRGAGADGAAPSTPMMPTTSRAGGLVLCESRGQQVAMSLDDMRHHAHLLGPTGSGKTTVLERTVLDAALDEGIGAGYIDPGDGTAIYHILERIPVDEWNRVVLIDPTHPDWAVGLNPLDCPDPHQREGVADQIVAIMRGLFERWGWGARMDDVMRAAVLTLMRHPGTTLCDVPPLLMDEVARARWTRSLDDPFGLGRFWAEYERMAARGQIPGVTPVLGKLRSVLLRPNVRVVLGQNESHLDLEEILDGRGILLAHLGKAKLGEDASALLGSFLVSQIWRAARQRAGTPEDERQDFWQVIDEFQNFAHSFETMGVALAESRSLRIGWGLAHQYPGQLSDGMWTAVEANTRTKMYFRGTDRSLLGDARLAEHQAVVTLRGGAPLVGTTLPPGQSYGSRHAEELATHSLALWGRPRREVDSALQERHRQLGVPEGADR